MTPSTPEAENTFQTSTAFPQVRHGNLLFRWSNPKAHKLVHADVFSLQMQDCPLDSFVDVACRDLITHHALLDTCSPLTADSIIPAIYWEQRFRIGFLSSRSNNTDLLNRPLPPVIVITRLLPMKSNKCSWAFWWKFSQVYDRSNHLRQRCTVKITESSARPLSFA